MTMPGSSHDGAPSRALVERRRRLRRVVLAEVAGLLALLRRNRKWASAENPLVRLYFLIVVKHGIGVRLGTDDRSI